MEAAHASRQVRLEALRDAKASSSTTSLHPFRRAFLTHVTPRAKAPLISLDGDEDANAEGSNVVGSNSAAGNASATKQTQNLVDSAPETALLRKFRNWDPMTGEPRQGAWNTVSGIEEEMKGVQEKVLREDQEARKRDLDLLNIAPRKANWDLRRDLDKRLKKLERRDREARLILIRQRLKAAAAAASNSVNGQGKEEAFKRQAELVAMSTVGRRTGHTKGVGVAEMDEASESDDEEE